MCGVCEKVWCVSVDYVLCAMVSIQRVLCVLCAVQDGGGECLCPLSQADGLETVACPVETTAASP